MQCKLYINGFRRPMCGINYSLAHVRSANIEGKGFMTYSAAHTWGVMDMFWLLIYKALMPIFIYSQWVYHSKIFLEVPSGQPNDKQLFVVYH